jgi:hypothetical protein
MRTTRAKFYLTGLTLLPGKDAGIQINLSAVARGDRNASWAKATPIGQLSMTVNNLAAAEQWDEFMRTARATGKQPEVFIDISPSEDGWPGDGHPFRLSDVAEGEYGHGKCSECGMGRDDDLRWNDPASGKAHPNG